MKYPKTNIIFFLVICFFAVILHGFHTEKQDSLFYDNEGVPENDLENGLIIVSSENEDQEQEDKTPPPAESAEKIVLELSCEENEALESNRDEFSLEANDFSITDSVDVICLDQPFDSSVTEKQEWNSSYKKQNF